MAYVTDGSLVADNSGELGGTTDPGGTGGGTPFFLGGDSGDSGDFRDASGNAFDPERHSGRDKFNRDGTFSLKRGRKGSGSRNSDGNGRRKARSRTDYSASVDALTRMIGYTHLGLAAAMKTPELALADEESQALANATVNVLEQFDIRPDPKVEAVVGLIVTAGTIYGPRVYMIKQRKNKEKQERNNQ